MALVCKYGYVNKLSKKFVGFSIIGIQIFTRQTAHRWGAMNKNGTERKIDREWKRDMVIR